jgi:hypothetical protein
VTFVTFQSDLTFYIWTYKSEMLSTWFIGFGFKPRVVPGLFLFPFELRAIELLLSAGTLQIS